MSRYAKAVMTFFTALGTWGGTALADSGITSVEWFGLCGVIVATVGVFAIPNTPPSGQFADPNMSEQGYTTASGAEAAGNYSWPQHGGESGAVDLMLIVAIATTVIAVVAVLFAFGEVPR